MPGGTPGYIGNLYKPLERKVTKGEQWIANVNKGKRLYNSENQ
jgi:hypothetical protein